MSKDENSITALETQRDEQGQTLLQDGGLNERAIHDRESFAMLYRLSAPRVYRYIFSQVNNHADAEDLTAQVFMPVMQKLKSFGGNRNFNARLFTIARNRVVDAYRKRERLIDLEAINDLPDPVEDVLTDFSERERLDQLGLLLGALPEYAVCA